jgi:hypothetical protein
MSTDNVYLAVFVGSKTSPRRAAWDALAPEQRQARQQEGIAVWGAWAARHQASIVEAGGPLGKTKRVSESGIVDSANELGAFVIVRAASHEAAARMFENHPHFTIFPGEAVEIMPVLALPNPQEPAMTNTVTRYRVPIG